MRSTDYYSFVRWAECPPHWNFQQAEGQTRCWQVTLWAIHLGKIAGPNVSPLGEAAGIGDTFEEAHAVALRKLRAVMAKVPND